MMWYEIPGFPGYRMSHLEEVMSVLNEEPKILKPHWTPGGYRILLRKDGKYVNRNIKDLWKATLAAGLPAGSVEPPERVYWQLLRTHCVNDHEFTPENTGRRKGRGKKGQDYRRCRQCHNDNMKRYRKRLANATEESLATE